MLTQSFEKLLRKSGKTPRSQGMYRNYNRDKRNANKQRSKSCGEKKMYDPSCKKEKGFNGKNVKVFATYNVSVLTD